MNHKLFNVVCGFAGLFGIMYVGSAHASGELAFETAVFLTQMVVFTGVVIVSIDTGEIDNEVTE